LLTGGGGAQAAIACSPAVSGVVLLDGSGTAAICSAPATLSGTRSAAIAVNGGTVLHSNAVVIAGTSLTSNGNNTLTSQTMFASAFNVTCDASEKADMSNVNVSRAEFITKLKATKPKTYRMKTDDGGAPKRRGFDAADLEAFDNVVVKKTRRVVKVRRTEDGKWEDKKGKKYNKADPTDSDDDDEDDDRPKGKVFDDEPLQHAYVDITAMMSLMWEGLQHMQSQIDELKTATVSVKVGL
jgi:hypothetical protein